MEYVIIADKLWNIKRSNTHILYQLQSDKAHCALIALKSEYWEYYKGITIIPEVMTALQIHAQSN